MTGKTLRRTFAFPGKARLACTANRMHNLTVRRRGGTILVLTRVLFVIAAVAASTLADLRASSAAMACCAQMDYSCTGMSAPDDCCQRMTHTPARAAAGTLSSAIQPGPPAAVVVPSFVADLNPGANFPLLAELLPRPHDPPHLHSYSLLI
jgi:hypothetical protein